MMNTKFRRIILISAVVLLFSMLFCFGANAEEISVPSNLKKTYLMFRSGTFGITYTIASSDGKNLPVETYVRNNKDVVLITKMSAEGINIESKSIYLDGDDKGYIFVNTGSGLGNFYSELSKDDLDKDGLTPEDFINTMAPAMNTNVPFTTETKEYNGKMCVCESYVSKEGVTVSYYFTENTLVAIEETSATGSSSILNVSSYTDSPDAGKFSLPRKVSGSFVGYMKIDIDMGSSCDHVDTDNNKVCDACEYALGEVSPETPHKHGYENNVEKGATCTEDGIGFRECRYCGATETYIIYADGFHEEIEIDGKAATCTATGLTDGEMCEKCGLIIVPQTEIPLVAHTEETIPGKAATCTATGLTDGKKCTVCGAVLVAQMETPIVAHTEETISGKAATCTATGLTDGKKCSVCGKVLVAQTEIPIVAHTEETIPGIAATCIATGLTDGKKCSVCGKVLVIQTETPLASHNFVEILAENPDCTKDGYVLNQCTVCRILSKTIKEKTGHTEIVVPAVSATCTTKGLTDGKKCTVCGEVTAEQITIPATGHKVTTLKAVKATYTKTGLTAGKKCKVCGKVTVKQKKVAKKKLKKVTISSVKSTKKKLATVTWKKVTDASGYIVEYSTSKKFTSKTTKKVTIKKGKTVKATLKKLKSGKKYYVRVKAYRTEGKKTVYGSYSSVKTVKVK